MKKKIALFITVMLAALLLLSACNGAKFELHTVTFDADGGELSLFEKSITVQTYGTADLPTPTKDGYVFEGWYVGEGANESQFTSTSMVTSDITLKAKWRKAEYTVTFVDYYGEVLARETVKHGEAANGPAVPRIDEKCLRFDTWDADISAVTADLTVQALYVLDSYTVTYVTNNSQTIPQASYLFDQIPAVPPTPGLEGHYFIGWYLDEEFTEEYLFDAPLTENITLYAYFNESIPISTLEELLAIPEYSSSNYFLKNDIDCEGAVITTQINGFTGTFDGGNHKVYNFVFQPASAAENGLFATNGGTIKNISFDNFSYTLTNTNINSKVGFVTGINTGTIENVHLTNVSISFTQRCSGGTSYTSYFGAITGSNNGEIINCSITNSAIHHESQAASWWRQWPTSTLFSGALVGENTGAIKDSVAETTNTGKIANEDHDSNNDQYSNLHIGGLVSVNNGSVSNCDTNFELISSIGGPGAKRMYAAGLVSQNKSEIAGCSAIAKIKYETGFEIASGAGFVHENRGTIKNSHARIEAESVVGNSIFGGFVAYNYAGIDRCYTQGAMNVGAATLGKGGFAAYNDGSINSCFADVSISATDAAKFGPLVGGIGTASYITNCYYNNLSDFTVSNTPHTFDEDYAEATYPLNLTDGDFILGTLGWDEDVWECDPNKLNHPTLK